MTKWEAYVEAADMVGNESPPGGFASPPFFLAVREAKRIPLLKTFGSFDRPMFKKAWVEVGQDPDYKTDPDYLRALKSGIWDAEEEKWLKDNGQL